MRALLILLAIIACVPLAACHRTAAVSGSFPPPDWPLAPLTLPPAAKLAEMPSAFRSPDGPAWYTRMRRFNQGSASEGEGWDVAFVPGCDYPALRSHIESCLKPLGFLHQQHPAPPQGGEAPEDTWWSADMKTYVRIYSMPFEHKANFYLQVNVHKQPQPQFFPQEAIP